MARSSETHAHDGFEPDDSVGFGGVRRGSVGCVAALLPRAKSWFHTKPKKEKPVSNSKAAGDSAGDPPYFLEGDNVGSSADSSGSAQLNISAQLRLRAAQGTKVEEVRISTTDKGEIRAELRRRYLAAHNRADTPLTITSYGLPRQSSCEGVAFAPARQDTERASEWELSRPASCEGVAERARSGLELASARDARATKRLSLPTNPTAELISAAGRDSLVRQDVQLLQTAPTSEHPGNPQQSPANLRGWRQPAGRGGGGGEG